MQNVVAHISRYFSLCTEKKKLANEWTVDARACQFRLAFDKFVLIFLK